MSEHDTTSKVALMASLYAVSEVVPKAISENNLVTENWYQKITSDTSFL